MLLTKIVGGAWTMETGWGASAPVVRAPISEPWGSAVLVGLAVFGGGVLAWVVLRLSWVLWQRWIQRRRMR